MFDILIERRQTWEKLQELFGKLGYEVEMIIVTHAELKRLHKKRLQTRKI